MIGEGASRAVVGGIRKILAGEVGIISVNEVLTMHLGPQDVLLNLSVDFGDRYSADDVEAAISHLERRIKDAYPEVTRVFIEAQSRRAHLQSREDTPATPD